MLTISQLARRFGLSRATLLYYDRIGLLSPSERSRSNYRLYSEEDLRRMERIHTYRQAGLPLADIAEVLAAEGNDQPGELLHARLEQLNREIGTLRRQQRKIVELLQNHRSLSRARCLDKEGWVEILRASGLSDDDMMRWHAEFERLAPEGHADFLASLGLDEGEIDRIRRHSREFT